MTPYLPLFTAIAVVIAALVALSGVIISQKSQAQQARLDREHALNLAREEREALLERERDAWQREQIYEQAGRIIDLVKEFESGDGDNNPVRFEKRLWAPIGRLYGLKSDLDKYERDYSLGTVINWSTMDWDDPDSGISIEPMRLWYLSDTATDIIRSLTGNAMVDQWNAAGPAPWEEGYSREVEGADSDDFGGLGPGAHDES